VDAIPGSEELAREMDIDRTRPLWVCGSTGPGEEEVILQAFKNIRGQCQLAIVPRKPERFDEVAEMIRKAGYACIRRSQTEPEAQARAAPTEPQAMAMSSDARVPALACASGSVPVYLGDTMGELRKFYILADVVFVGRTLANMGGSDMMEVAALAKPIVVGPHTENFADTMQQLVAADAIRVIDCDLNDPRAADILAANVCDLLEHREDARRIGERGREVVKQNRGATERTLKRLMEILNQPLTPNP